MSRKPAAGDPGWTLLTLKEHLETLIAAKDVRDQQRYEASEKALTAALSSADRAVQAALLAAKEAVTKAELAADERFKLLNELRTGVATTDQLDALEKVVNDLSRRMDTGEGRAKGVSATWATVMVCAGLIVAIIGGAVGYLAR